MKKRDPFFIILCGVTILVTLFFLNSNLDFWAARLFYHPEAANKWFEESNQPWEFFYKAAPWLTGVLLFTALSLLIFGKKFKERFFLRRAALFVIFVIALGPGLFVNTLFKPYWGRPRPREVIELGGHFNYRPFYLPDFASGGKSFPCGHCSVGFSYSVGYFIFRRRNFPIAMGFLIFSIIFGLMMGIGRIAAGGHFLSDVLWAGLMVFWVSYWISQRILDPSISKDSSNSGQLKSEEIEKNEEGEKNEESSIAALRHDASSVSRKRESTDGHLNSSSMDQTTFVSVWIKKISLYVQTHRGVEWGIYGLLALLTVTALLLASPFQSRINLGAGMSPENWIEISDSSVEIVDNKESQEMRIEGLAKGFGFPGGKMVGKCHLENNKTLCKINRLGFFSDFESVVKVIIPFQRCQQIEIHLVKSRLLNQEELPDCFNYLKNLQ